MAAWGPGAFDVYPALDFLERLTFQHAEIDATLTSCRAWSTSTRSPSDSATSLRSAADGSARSLRPRTPPPAWSPLPRAHTAPAPRRRRGGRDRLGLGRTPGTPFRSPSSTRSTCSLTRASAAWVLASPGGLGRRARRDRAPARRHPSPRVAAGSDVRAVARAAARAPGQAVWGRHLRTGAEAAGTGSRPGCDRLRPGCDPVRPSCDPAATVPWRRAPVPARPGPPGSTRSAP